MHKILRKLEGRDRRSIGRANEVVRDVLADPTLFRALFAGLRSANPVIRARAADAVEKVTVAHPEYLVRYKKALIGSLWRTRQMEVRWHVAQMLPRVQWTRSERLRLLSILESYLNDESSIVKTFAMQALADLADQAPELNAEVLPRLRELTATGTPAMRARGRMLIARLGASKRPRKRR